MGQAHRMTRPQPSSWHRTSASVGHGTLPQGCAARSATSCVSIVFLIVNDEEGWKLQRGIMLQLDRKNKSGWKHGKPGRSRWEGVKLRALGP